MPAYLSFWGEFACFSLFPTRFVSISPGFYHWLFIMTDQPINSPTTIPADPSVHAPAQEPVQEPTQERAQEPAQELAPASVDTQPEAPAPVAPEESPAAASVSEPVSQSPVSQSPVQQSPASETPAPQTPAAVSTPAAVDPGAQAAVELPDDVNAEIEAAMADMDAAANAAGLGSSVGGPAKPKLKGPRVVQGGREHRTGAVVSVGPTDVFIEFGPKELGVVDRQQFREGTDRAVPLPAAGELLEVVVQRFEPSENLFVCVLPGSVQKADWEMLEQGQVVEAKVTGTNKGGLELEVAGHRAFMPASQVDVGRVPDLSVYVGEKIECVVQRIDRRGKGNIVCSRREILAQERAVQAEKLKETLQEGQELEGTVRKIMDFGAFVDLGGIDGLIHLNDLSHDRVAHGAKNVARHVSEGQTVRVQVMNVDWDNNRIGLGLKQLQADPFAAAASEVVEGAELTGKVVRVLDFGCFVEVAPGVEGLVHISELDYKRVNAVSDVVQEGEVVQVKVLRVEAETRKIGLSIKALKEAPAAPKGSGGRGRGRGGSDDRSPDEILKETPALRRMREAAKRRAFERDAEWDDETDQPKPRKERSRETVGAKESSKGGQKDSGGGGLGDLGGLGGLSLGDLKL